jgi:hypothetical protein
MGDTRCDDDTMPPVREALGGAACAGCCTAAGVAGRRSAAPAGGGFVLACGRAFGLAPAALPGGLVGIGVFTRTLKIC